jgi:hypothetical protein
MSWSSVGNSETIIIDQYTTHRDYDLEKKTTALTPSHILVDVSHGNEVYIPAKASAMGGFLEGTQEYNVSTLLWQTVNDSVLADVDVLVITHPDSNIGYSASEIQAVKNFWNNGGSILFVGSLPFGEKGLSNTELNRIISEMSLDIHFNNSLSQTDHAIGLDTSLPTHPLTYKLNELYQRGAQISAGPGTPTQAISTNKYGYANSVVWNDSTNRAVFLGSTDPLLEFIFATANQDSNWNNHTHHYQYIYNIFNWLSYRPEKSTEQITPLKVNTGFKNPINQTYLENLTMYTGVAHVHTLESRTPTYYSDFANSALAMGYEFIVVADYNTIAGGPILREFFEYNSIPIHVIDGEEATKTQWHTTGWGLTSTIDPSPDPQTRIQQFHDQGSPIILAHPPWYPYTDYPRIWDLREYPFDGFEIADEGFIQGGGNLATKYPFYGGSDAKTPEVTTTFGLASTFNYVFSDGISDDPDWWTDAFFNRRIVVYIPKDDLYIGDKILVEEVVKRLNETDRFPYKTPSVPTVSYPKPPSDSTTTTEQAPGFLGVLVIATLAISTKKKK